MVDRWGDNGKNDRIYLFIYFYFKSVQMVSAAMKLKDACSLEGKS